MRLRCFRGKKRILDQSLYDESTSPESRFDADPGHSSARLSAAKKRTLNVHVLGA